MSIHPLETPEAWALEPFNPHEIEGYGSIAPGTWVLPEDDPEGKDTEIEISAILAHLAIGRQPI